MCVDHCSRMLEEEKHVKTVNMNQLRENINKSAVPLDEGSTLLKMEGMTC